MGISFKDLEKAQELYNKYGMKAKDVEDQMNILWKANNMDVKMQKAHLDLFLYGKAEMDITNIKEK